MTSPVDIVKRMNQAFEAKDTASAKTLLHPQYKFKGPMMEMNSPEEVLGFMQACPFACHSENISIMAEGNRVAQTFDWVSTAPVAFRIRMCSIAQIGDGKIKSEEMFYDTAKFPKAAQDIMQQMMQSKAA